MPSDLPSDASPRPLIDWRGADWYATSRAANDKQRASHDAAVTFLEEHEATAKPFALFLRFFDIRPVYDGPDGDPVKALAIELHDELRARGANLIRVQDSGEIGRSIDEISHEIPSLLLDDARWFEVVKALITRAEMIVCECPRLGAGLTAELTAVVELARVDRAVIVVVEAPGVEYAGNEDVIQPFYRVMLTQELDAPHSTRSFVFTDLLQRIEKLAQLETGDRVAAARQGTLDQLAPITFRGLAIGLMKIAQRYAELKSPGGTYSAGVRAAKAAAAASGPVLSIRYLMRTADLCELSGHATLALTVLDDAEKASGELGTNVNESSKRRLSASLQRRYHALLSRIFEPMMNSSEAQQLWQLANSRAAHALQHHTPAVMAQCLAWMAAAAVVGERYDLAKDNAGDAIMIARSCRNRFYEGFASVYLGHAERRLGQFEESARAYASAISLLGTRKVGPIHAIARLSLAQVAEQLGKREEARELYASSRALASAMHASGIEEAATQGEQRLAASA